MKNSFALSLYLVGLTASAWATPQTFDFKDPKGVNNAVFKLDATLESITGSANGISGTITFDPEKPATATGKIVVATSSLHVGNPMMKEHLHGNQWMDVAKYPEITFEAKELKNVKTNGDIVTADVRGTFTTHGVSKELTIPVKFTYLKDKLGVRTGGRMQGDLLVVRSNFSINRSDFGINPKAPKESVSESIELSLSVAGAAAKQ